MIDLHSDTISRFLREKPEANLIDNPFSISRGRLEKGGIGAQCMALFVYNDGRINPWEKLNILHDRFLSELSLSGIPQLRDIGEYDGTLKAILTTEEGASIEGRLERLETLKEWGVLIFGLVWNFENELCYPNSRDKEIMRQRLKDKGFDAIAECERLGIAIDVSHLNDGGFWDVVKASHKPFMATHSNARAITDVPRNLTDEMIHALADKGGVMGLNLCPAFLYDIPEGTKEEDAESPDLFHGIVRAEIYDMILKAVDELPTECGRVFRMAYLDGLENEEIAVRLGISINTVKSQKNKAKTQLREILKDLYPAALLFLYLNLEILLNFQSCVILLVDLFVFSKLYYSVGNEIYVYDYSTGGNFPSVASYSVGNPGDVIKAMVLTEEDSKLYVAWESAAGGELKGNAKCFVLSGDSEEWEAHGIAGDIVRMIYKL